LEKTFKFKNFAQALEFTNKIGAIAEEENHHPLIITEWGRVTLYRPTPYQTFGNPGYQYVYQ
jgi:pterin-4a-carbinolamine dehydratase